ncbi:LysR family transcriptional regulator [Psychromonas aquimarina]|uniref:LysR family transcriptional regulator n=1 Tax=Psychromonas aquimarina TaxID=444919 RepID=UPI00042189A9|nr:LysR family transcriptional regulator [Psychromonas aquimarina]
MLRFSFEQLSAFIAVAETGSFSKAAKSLHKDRSTLHQQVGNLEIDLGITLFDRSGKFPKITFEGESLLTQAKHILYQAQLLQNSGDSLAGGLEKSLTIYHDISLPISVIIEVQNSVQEQFPNTRLNWIHRGKGESIKALAQQRADIALVLGGVNAVLPEKGLAFTNLGYLPFSFFAHKDTQLGKSNSCSLPDLEQNLQYVAENHMEVGLGKMLQISSQQAVISNTDIILSLLKEGGWALLPNHVVSSSANAQQIKKLNIDFMNSDGRWSFVLLTRTQQNIGKVKSTTINEFKKSFKSLNS